MKLPPTDLVITRLYVEWDFDTALAAVVASSAVRE